MMANQLQTIQQSKVTAEHVFIHCDPLEVKTFVVSHLKETARIDNPGTG